MTSSRTCGFDSCGLDRPEKNCLRMGASPQISWLRGAGVPLRSPPGGAFRLTGLMGVESFIELAPVEEKLLN